MVPPVNLHDKPKAEVTTTPSGLQVCADLPRWAATLPLEADEAGEGTAAQRWQRWRQEIQAAVRGETVKAEATRRLLRCMERVLGVHDALWVRPAVRLGRAFQEAEADVACMERVAEAVEGCDVDRAWPGMRSFLSEHSPLTHPPSHDVTGHATQPAMLCSDAARALPGTAVAWNFSGWGTGRHFTPIHDDIPALVTPPLSGFVRQIQAAVPACADLAVRFADVEDAPTLLRVNEVNPAFQNEGDFVASVREKNEYTLLAELGGRVVGFVNYYFMWLSERPEHAGQATAPKVIPQQVVYIATLQSVRQTTHAEYVAEIDGTTAPRYTGLLLLLTALRHAMLCGMTAACVDSTEGAASFYRQVCGFTVTGATHMTSPVRNRVGRTGLLPSIHAPLPQPTPEPSTTAASSRPSAAAPLFQSQITLPKPAPPPQQYPPLAASAAVVTGAHPQELPRTPVRQRQGRYVPMTLPLVGVDLYAPFRYRVQAAMRERPVQTQSTLPAGVHKLNQSSNDLDIGISSSLVHRPPTAVAQSSSTTPATEPVEQITEEKIGELDDTADYITTIQRLLVAQSLANHHAAERLLDRVRAHEEAAEAGAEAAQYEEDMWDSFALRVEQEQMAEEERQRKQEKNQDAHCLVCDGDVSSPGNHIVFCERCDLAVHQQCYGVPVIPDGDWFCDSCAWWKRTPVVHRDLAAKPAVCAGVTFSADDPHVKANATRFINVLRVPSPACRFCGVRGGAMKPILNDPPQAEHDTHWAHIVCAYALGVTMASDAATGVRADLLLGCRLPSHLHSLLYESPADAVKDEPEIDQDDATSSSAGRPSRHQEQQLEPARVCALCTRPYGLLVHSGRKSSKSLPSESELVHPSCAFMHGLLYPLPPVAVSHKAAAEADAFPRPAIEFRADANTCELAPTWKVVHPGLLTTSKRRGPVWREDQRHKAEQERRRARPTTARMKPKQSASTTPSRSKRRGRRQTEDSSDSEESVLDESESEADSSDQWSSDDGAPRRSRRGRRQRRQQRRARRRRSSKQSSPAINPEHYCDGDICHVCYDGSTVPENSILYCERCSVAAHQGCAGVARVPDGDWLCRVCAGGGDPTQLACEICGLAGGLFTDVVGNTSAGPNKSGGKWCHVLCAIWTPETLFADYRTVRAVQNIDAIDAKRRQLQCKVCRRKGAVVSSLFYSCRWRTTFCFAGCAPVCLA